MVKLDIVNPQAKSVVEAVRPAPRQGELSGKTVGLYWNLKAGGDVALERTARILEQRIPGTTFKNFVGSVGATLRHATSDDVARVARECDAVVGTTSD